MKRRKSRRTFTAVRIELMTSEGKLVSEASILNISKGGLLIAYVDQEQKEFLRQNKQIKLK